MEGGRRCRRAYVLWTEPSGSVPACCHLRRQDPERRQTRRPPRGAAHQIRTGDQHEDRQGARADDPADVATASGSGDPVVDRRRFLLTSLAGALAAPRGAGAQQPTKIVRIGYLTTADVATAPHHLREAFLKGLRDLGYVEGRNLVIEYRSAEGKVERLPALAAELVALKVDVIVTAHGTHVALVANKATRTLPIVFTSVADPVTSGLVTSLA